MFLSSVRQNISFLLNKFFHVIHEGLELFLFSLQICAHLKTCCYGLVRIINFTRVVKPSHITRIVVVLDFFFFWQCLLHIVVHLNVLTIAIKRYEPRENLENFLLVASHAANRIRSRHHKLLEVEDFKFSHTLGESFGIKDSVALQLEPVQFLAGFKSSERLYSIITQIKQSEFDACLKSGQGLDHVVGKI